MNRISKTNLLAGVLAELIATFMLALSAFLAFLGMEIRQVALCAAISVYPALIGTSLLNPELRSVTLRLLCGITCLGIAGVVVGTFLGPNNFDWRGRYYLLVMCVASGVIAVNGKWPTKKRFGN